MPDPIPNQTPPPADAGLRAVHDFLRSVFVLFRIVAVLLLLGFCFSGVRNLEEYQKAVVLRFGAVHAVKEDPGLIFALPYPIDRLERVPAKRTQTLTSQTFWREITDAERAAATVDIRETLRAGQDGYLLTSDRSIIHARATLKYRINNLPQYSFGTAALKDTLQAGLDNAMVKSAATMTVEQLLREKNVASAAITRELQQFVDTLELGIVLDPVDLQLRWPAQVQAQRTAVAQAQHMAQQERNAAALFAQEQENETESARAQVLVDAETWAAAKVSRIRADAETFAKLYPVYRDNPKVLRQTLYQAQMRQIMNQAEELFMLEEGPRHELRLNVTRNRDRKKKDGADGKR